MVDWSLNKPCRWNFIIYLFISHFLRGHQELSINTSYAIFEKMMRVVIAQSFKELLKFC